MQCGLFKGHKITCGSRLTDIGIPIVKRGKSDQWSDDGEKPTICIHHKMTASSKEWPPMAVDESKNGAQCHIFELKSN